MEDIDPPTRPVSRNTNAQFGHGTTRPHRGIEFSDRTNIANIELLEAHLDNQ